MKANLAVARSLHEFAIAERILGREQVFSSLPTGAGQRVSYWLPMVLSHEDRPIIPFIDPSRSRGRSRAARRFVFSMMHEHIRVADPDYEDVQLAIFQFGNPEDGLRAPKLHVDEDVDLIPLPELEVMVAFTYGLWRDVSEEREVEARRARAANPKSDAP